MKIVDKTLRLIDRGKALGLYLWEGVWRDPSSSMKVRIIKTANLCVRTFLDKDLQNRAASLVYSTLLAIVPAFALLFAIGRGFGLQNVITQELYRAFPAQAKVLAQAMKFVDSYLAQASQGVFVGVGIVFLLWTLISLMSQIEAAFNSLWGVRTGRNFYRKITDYTALCLLVPVMVVCSAGINIFMATMMQSLLGDTALSPMIGYLLDCAPFLLYCVAFMLSFLIIPNTHVSFKYAAISGLICGIAFQLVQTIFISGQIYVAKYNAIYGSFAFLPLLLIWLQLSWLILLFGCTLTYSLQNIFHFTFAENIDDIAPDYQRKITIALAAVIASRFRDGQKPMMLGEISAEYGLPIRIIQKVARGLHECGIIYYVDLKADEQAVAPAVELSTFTVADLLRRMENCGSKDFISGFESRYAAATNIARKVTDAELREASLTLLADIHIPAPEAK